ncbi:MAG: 3-phosphoserine/phosphohydroxythreonine transaminase [Coriobacteriales bacterium]|nr:3-phosphoserine/phosphohydroxythreonine transaminase [Coriobacteriales bacterium]
MNRVYNFNAGPAALPEEVLQKAANSLVNYNGLGLSVMEMSHRSHDFETILEDAQNRLRDLAQIPENYRILFLQGGGCQQFAAVPMNLMSTGKAAYVISGTWSKKAAQEAKMYGEVYTLASGEDQNFSCLPSCEGLAVPEDASYIYLCQNETIHGIEYRTLPVFDSAAPLVVDASSCFLSEPMEVAKCGLMYAGAQKNVGPAGVVIVIIREDLIREDVWPGTPTVMRYSIQAKNNSLYNTPPCWSIYMCGLVFEWIQQNGGLKGMQARNEAKAQMLYDFLDKSSLFKPKAKPGSRSIMNVTFSCGSPELDAEFVALTQERGFVGIKGHRSVGGMRASTYNAVPLEAVEALVSLMQEFENNR